MGLFIKWLESYEKSPLDIWANFLANERLTPQRVAEPMVLVKLAEELSKRGLPYFRPYAKRLESRRLVVNVAMDLSIDLAKMEHHGKMAMARSLLDIWNEEYAKRFGSSYGTAGWRETYKRRKSLGLSAIFMTTMM